MKMSDAVQIAIISGVVTIVGAFLNYKIERIHKQINSRMDEHLAAVKALGLSEGKAAGKVEERKEVKERKGK